MSFCIIITAPQPQISKYKCVNMKHNIILYTIIKKFYKRSGKPTKKHIHSNHKRLKLDNRVRNGQRITLIMIMPFDPKNNQFGLLPLSCIQPIWRGFHPMFRCNRITGALWAESTGAPHKGLAMRKVFACYATLTQYHMTTGTRRWATVVGWWAII